MSMQRIIRGIQVQNDMLWRTLVRLKKPVDDQDLDSGTVQRPSK